MSRLYYEDENKRDRLAQPVTGEPTWTEVFEWIKEKFNALFGIR